VTYKEISLIARSGSIRKSPAKTRRTLTPLGTIVLVTLLVLAAGYAGGYEFDTQALVSQGDLER